MVNSRLVSDAAVRLARAQPVALRSVRSKPCVATRSPKAWGMSGQGSQVNVRTLYTVCPRCDPFTRNHIVVSSDMGDERQGLNLETVCPGRCDEVSDSSTPTLQVEE